MDESLSWQARLAKRNINILNIDDLGGYSVTVYYEFMYHPKPGQTKWCKTMTRVYGQESELSDGTGYPLTATGEDIANTLSEEVLSLRKELEG